MDGFLIKRCIVRKPCEQYKGLNYLLHDAEASIAGWSRLRGSLLYENVHVRLTIYTTIRLYEYMNI